MVAIRDFRHTDVSGNVSAKDARLPVDAPQLGDASDLDPLDHEDVTGVVETGAMRTNEFPGVK